MTFLVSLSRPRSASVLLVHCLLSLLGDGPWRWSAARGGECLSAAGVTLPVNTPMTHQLHYSVVSSQVSGQEVEKKEEREREIEHMEEETKTEG